MKSAARVRLLGAVIGVLILLLAPAIYLNTAVRETNLSYDGNFTWFMWVPPYLAAIVLLVTRSLSVRIAIGIALFAFSIWSLGVFFNAG